MVLWIWMLIRTFFWWNSDDSNLKEPESWFIQDITSTWNTSEINTWIIDNTWDTQPDKEKKDYIEIRVMMPKYFYNSWWKKFAEDLYNEKKVYMNFVFIDDLNAYKENLYKENFDEADLILLPYDRIDKVSTRVFSPNNTESLFDQLIQPFLKSTQISFLPFAADPMIMYAVSWYLTQNDFPSIYNFVYDREGNIPLSFPIFFGITSEDYYDQWFKREYQDIVRYALMHYFTTYNDSNSLWKRIDSNEIQKYNVWNLNTISNLITAPECKYFPSICFQIYKFVWIRFGFLSDTDIVNNYFKWKKTYFNGLSKNPVPFSQLETPIRLRWRWMPSSLQDKDTIKWVNTFFARYTKNHNDYKLRNSTLSVFDWDNWTWLIYNDYIWIRGYILTSGWDYINTVKWIDKFWDLIEYSITPRDYFK